MLTGHNLMCLRKIPGCGILSALRSVRGVIVGYHTRVFGLSATTEFYLKFELAVTLLRSITRTQQPTSCLLC
jgi:hypothetical protein